MSSRRTFLIGGLALGSAAVLGRPVARAAAQNPALQAAPARSRVVIARDRTLRGSGESTGISSPLDSDRLGRLLDDAMQNLFAVDHPLTAWSTIVSPTDMVGLKVNCLAGRGLSTDPDLVDVICERLRAIGLPDRQIVIWDRQNSDLEEAGYQVATRGSGIRCFGNDAIGFDQQLYTFGSAGSLVTQTLTGLCDVVINLPVLKDHGITGFTGALKNMFGAIHNPNKYHLGVGNPYIPDVYCLAPIRRKVRLTICDATTAQYEGGPAFFNKWSWPFNGLLVSTDPVALDTTGWRIIEDKRKLQGLQSLRENKREPSYIATAADAAHRLGTSDHKQIDLLEVERS